MNDSSLIHASLGFNGFRANSRCGRGASAKGAEFQTESTWLTRRLHLGRGRSNDLEPARSTTSSIETARSLGSIFRVRCDAGDGQPGADATMRSRANCSYEAVEAALVCVLSSELPQAAT